jgi:hypothetical protein
MPASCGTGLADRRDSAKAISRRSGVRSHEKEGHARLRARDTSGSRPAFYLLCFEGQQQAFSADRETRSLLVRSAAGPAAGRRVPGRVAQDPGLQGNRIAPGGPSNRARSDPQALQESLRDVETLCACVLGIGTQALESELRELAATSGLRVLTANPRCNFASLVADRRLIKRRGP